MNAINMLFEAVKKHIEGFRLLLPYTSTRQDDLNVV